MIYFKISFSFLWTPMSLLIAQSVKHTKIGNLREFSQDDGRLPFLGLLPFKGESRGPKRPGFCWIGKWEVTPCTPNNCIDIIEIFIERLAYIIYDIYGYATMWKCAIRSHGRKQQRQRRGIITNLLIRSYIYIITILCFICHAFSYLSWNSRYTYDVGHPACKEDSLSFLFPCHGVFVTCNQSMICVAVFVQLCCNQPWNHFTQGNNEQDSQIVR